MNLYLRFQDSWENLITSVCSRPAKNGEKKAIATKCLMIPKKEDAFGRIKLHPALIKSPRNKKGLLRRKEYAKVFNKITGTFYIAEVEGKGNFDGIHKPTDIAIGYEGRAFLGLNRNDDDQILDLEITRAGWFDMQYYCMYMNRDSRSKLEYRQSLTLNLLSVGGGFMLGAIGWIIPMLHG